MTATVYLANAVLERLDRAQAEIDRHVAADTSGHCLACGQEAPCSTLTAATATFAKYHKLPVRRPGLASRGLAASERFGWFAALPPAAHDG